MMQSSTNSATKTLPRKRRRSSTSSSPSITTPSSPTNNNHHHHTIPTPKPLTAEQQRTQHYSDQLTSNPSFLGNRSPFYETVSRHCVMPICQKQLINFQFNLPPNYVGDIKNGLRSKKRRKCNHDNSTTQRVLHIRLFNLSTTKHVEWNPDYFKLRINDKSIKMLSSNKQKKKNKMGSKSKGFRFIQPLDISKYASSTMSFEIRCLLNIFHGAASIEIVNVLTVDEVLYSVAYSFAFTHLLIFFFFFLFHRLQRGSFNAVNWHPHCMKFAMLRTAQSGYKVVMCAKQWRI